MKEDTCSECGKPVHPERRRVLPNTRTCGAKCSADRQRRLTNRRSKRYQAKRRANKK